MDKTEIYKHIEKHRERISQIRDSLEGITKELNVSIQELLKFEIEFLDEKVANGEFTKEMLPLLIAHTDGACSGNPGPGGWAFTTEGDVDFEGSGSIINTTNNQMELMAIIKFLEATPGHQPVKIYTDSEMTMKCAIGINKRKANANLWERYNKALKGRIIDIKWEARDSTVGNRRANKLAQAEAEKLKVETPSIS